MFLDWRKQNTSAASAAHPTDSALSEAGNGTGTAWRAWRRSAQNVTRAWKTWLAAEGRQRAEFYRLYVAALAEEERAAARIEHSVNLGASGQGPSDCIPCH
jgi:hypothetical protein